MKPIFLIGTQPIKYVVAFDKAITMVIMDDGEKVAITESVDEFVTSVNDL